MSRELPDDKTENFTMIGKTRLRCLDTVRGSTVTKNSNLMRHLDTLEGIQPITRRVSVTSDTLWYGGCIFIAQETIKIIVNTRKLYLILLTRHFHKTFSFCNSSNGFTFRNRPWIFRRYFWQIVNHERAFWPQTVCLLSVRRNSKYRCWNAKCNSRRLGVYAILKQFHNWYLKSEVVHVRAHRILVGYEFMLNINVVTSFGLHTFNGFALNVNRSICRYRLISLKWH